MFSLVVLLQLLCAGKRWHQICNVYHDVCTIWVQCRGGWTRSRESEKNALIALGRANQDVDLSSSLPSLAGLQLQDALEI